MVLLCSKQLTTLELYTDFFENSTQNVAVEGNNTRQQDMPCNQSFKNKLDVCSVPANIKDYGNFRNSYRALMFQLNKMDVKIFIKSHQITLPNASIFFSSKNNNVPIYHEEISKNLHSFYCGSFVFKNMFFPFTAKWDGFKLTGTAVYESFLFKIQCSKMIQPNFYLINHCFPCYVSCNEIKPTNTSHCPNDIQHFFKEPFYFHSKQKTQHKPKPVYSNKRFPRHEESDTLKLPKPLSCSLHLVADHLFFKYIGAGSVTKSVNTMLSVINDADSLFRSSDFDGDGYGDNVGFIVAKVSVYRHENEFGYRLSKSYMTSDEYLKQFSYYDFDDVCLGIAFTFRTMDGVAGTAYPAVADESLPGGICEKRIKINSHHASFNTVIVTYLSNGIKLKNEDVVLTVLHEIGHSFGARHDSSSQCFPNDEKGNYIMNPNTNPGNKPNNRKFSVCSLRYMLPVIKKKGSCLLEDNIKPHCGNSIPEAGEECDCGISTNCLSIDPCCTPADFSGSDTPCTVRRSKGKQCTPKTQSCCSSNCSFIPASEDFICNTLDGCSVISKCNGLSGHCPVSHAQPDGTSCNNGLLVCKSGVCTEDVCHYHNMTNCLCSHKPDQCKLCCKQVKSQLCSPLSSAGTYIQHDIGVQCYDNGFCSSSHACSQILINSLREDEGLFGFSSEREFQIHIANYWFYYLLMLVFCLFIIIILTISYQSDDVDYLKALRYGKMLAIFAIGEYQTKVYRKTLLEIDEYYSNVIFRVQNQSQPLEYTEALGRLKMLFPAVSLEYLSRIAKISATEQTAVRILLIQGFKMKTFGYFTSISINPEIRKQLKS